MDTHMEGGSQGAQATVSNIYVAFREFLSRYGWPILILLFLLYYFRPQIKKLQADYSLKKANNPYRVQILDEDMKRVRARQQLDHLKNIEKSITPSTGAAAVAIPRETLELPEGC
jgi:hypothetical protein